MTLNRCRCAMLVTSLLCALLTGCGQSNVRFQWTRASLARNARGDEVVQFDAAIVTKGLAGKQALYQVCVDDCDGYPVMSQDAYYRNRSGQVAAARTFHIGLPFQQISDLTVSIPVSQLEASEDQLPISAQVGIYTPSGEALATTRCDLPEDAVRTSVALQRAMGASARANLASGENGTPSGVAPQDGGQIHAP